MSTTPGQLFTLNGANFDGSILPPEGQKLLSLVSEAQAELARLEIRKALLEAAQQQLISQLKPLLPAPITAQPTGAVGILGHASDQIPSTTVEEPKVKSAPFPENVPEEIRAK